MSDTMKSHDVIPATDHVTFCRICEPYCGLIVSVAGGRVTEIKGDKDNPSSRGYLCPKGSSMQQLQSDPDRVLKPLRRVGGPGEFEECSWEEAMDDIAARVKRIIKVHGASAVGGYLGNPAGMHSGHMYWLTAFLDALGSPHLYSAGSQDTNTRMVASNVLYGSPLLIPFPDVKRTQFMLMFGANPLVSKGSLWTAPRVRQHLGAIVRRGGRVVVVDPRRSETAKAFEYRPIRADTDAWLLAALINEVFEQGLEDRAAIQRMTTGVERLRAMCKDVSVDAASARTGIPADEIRSLARNFANAPSAVAYTRTGICTGSFGTAVNFLADALNVITGNLDRPGGSVFGDPPVSFVELGQRFGLASVGGQRTRIGGLPRVANLAPSVSMPGEIATAGEGQLRALFVGAGNVVLSTPGATAVEESLEALDLLVCLDLYVTETSKHADYILPGTTFLERADMPVTNLQWQSTPFVQATERVIDPPGECREEHLFYEDLTRRIGLSGPKTVAWLRWLAVMSWLRPSPMQMIDLMVRTGPKGDRYGLRRNGLTLKKILAHPHGLVLAEQIATGIARHKIVHEDRMVHLDDDQMQDELRRLVASPEVGGRYPLRLIGRREIRSHNSWMHNVPSNHTMAPLQISHADAAARGINKGERVRVSSPDGALLVEADVTDDVVEGTIVLPHGWGHQGGGWQRANANPGVNYNVLTSSRPETAEQISGMSLLNGVPVEVERAVGSSCRDQRDLTR